MKKLLLITLSLITVSAFARLGETKYQCKKRYGNPIVEKKSSSGWRKRKRDTSFDIRKSKSEYHYKKNGIDIYIKFDHRGRAKWIKYSPVKTDQKVKTLLKVNSKKKKWKELSKENYKRSDKKAYAYVYYSNPTKEAYKAKYDSFKNKPPETPYYLIISTAPITEAKTVTVTKKKASLSGF